MEFSQIITFLFVGIGLSFDSFAVSVSCGLAQKDIRFQNACIIAASMAFFQALFPVIGWFIGVTLKDLIAALDHWIAFGLLCIVGVKMVAEGIKNDGKLCPFNPFRPMVLICLSIATSIDALVVGLSYGLLNTRILIPVLLIGIITFVASMLGILFGKKIPSRRSRQSIILGGIILIAIGTRILIQHLT